MQRYAHPVPVLFLGMNPGPFGMAQTGVPFGEVAAVRDWLGIETPIDKPRPEHPKRPVLGFACPRSEVSGRRLWGLMRERFTTPERFFASHFVINYCPLVFMEESGRNITPDKLALAEKKALFRLCDRHLAGIVELFQSQTVIGIGKFAAGRAEIALQGKEVQVFSVLHPSPANPRANRGWAEQATSQLESAGIW